MESAGTAGNGEVGENTGAAAPAPVPAIVPSVAFDPTRDYWTYTYYTCPGCGEKALKRRRAPKWLRLLGKIGMKRDYYGCVQCSKIVLARHEPLF